MGQAKQRGTYRDRKSMAEFYKKQSEMYQEWLWANRPRESAQSRIARRKLGLIASIACGVRFKAL